MWECENDCCICFRDSSPHRYLTYPFRRLGFNLHCRLCCYYTISCIVIATLLVSLGFTIFFATYSPQRSLPTSVDVGGNVSVLLDPAGFDPFWYDQVEVTTASNITLFRGICDDLSTVHIQLPPKKISFKVEEFRVPFNYFGGDTPVYSADGTNGSFLRFNISAEAENQNGSLSCGIQLFSFANFTSYNDFLNNEFTNNTTQQNTQCIPVGPPGSPFTSSVTFYLNEPGFYWQAMTVDASVSSVNSSVSGSLFHHNLSSLDSVHCSDFQNIRNCTIRISTLPSTRKPFMCVLVLAKNYTTVYFRGLRSIWNVGTITIATIFTIMFLLYIYSLCCCIFMSRQQCRHHDVPLHAYSTVSAEEPWVIERDSEDSDESRSLCQDIKSFRTIYSAKFDKNGLKYHLSNHGITVIIPENAVDGDALLRIGVYYNVDSAIQFPHGYKLVSDIFWIDSSIPLLKDVELYIPHCVKTCKENESKRLGFFMASDEFFRTHGVLKFREIPEHTYDFEHDSSYGKLVIDHFCSGCILEKMDEKALPLQYLVTRVLPNDCDKSIWMVDLVFSYALPTCHKVIEEQYPSCEYSLKGNILSFTQPTATLDYSFEPAAGWLIKHADMIQYMSEERIDYWKVLDQECSGDEDAFWQSAYMRLERLETIMQYPPRLSLEITRTKYAREHLRTNITVNGVMPHLKIELAAPCPAAQVLKSNATTTAAAAAATAAAAAASAVTTTTTITTTIPIKERDQFLRTAMLLLQDDLGTDWFTFGLYLDVDVRVLNRLNRSYLTHVDYRNSTREMLTAWTNKFDREASWDKIVVALRKIGNNVLAQQVEKQYIQPTKQTVDEETSDEEAADIQIRKIIRVNL